jgi:predicted nucleotidyltransferase
MINEVLKQINIEGRVIYLTQYGSHLYGLNGPNSDLDFRGVFIPRVDDLILHKDKDEINDEIEIKVYAGEQTDYSNEEIDAFPVYEKKKVDVKIFSLQKFIQLCSKADTNALDLLFSVAADIEKYREMQTIDGEHKAVMRYIYENRDKLINTGDLYHLIKYAHSQEKKYGEKYERYKKICEVIEKAKLVMATDFGELTVENLLSFLEMDGKYLKLTEHDNKGKLEKYLWVAGTEQQYNLNLKELITRLEHQIETNYSDRTKKAFGEFGIDWKAMSHALRISYEGLELVKHGTITFPILQRQYLYDIKSGIVPYEEVSHEISRALDELTRLVDKDELGWRYDEDFWNEFILQEVKSE